MENIQLSPRFSLYELTITANRTLQVANRVLSNDQIAALRVLAQHCEEIRELCGSTPVRIHSGYRSPDLNGATAGSSPTSQHLRCEAVDFDVPGQTVEDSFTLLLTAARAGKFRFGQLIVEEAKDRFGEVANWVHCSVVGTLDSDKIGQVLRKKYGSNGNTIWNLFEIIRFKDVALPQIK